jgi:lipopolysaccharide/colanic/teichoic acid biosynthesis glycosyltransferase
MSRRCVDVFVSCLGLIFLAPLFALVALLVRVVDGSPILFLQNRAGLNGVPFRMFKFRTMRKGAEQSGGLLTFRADQRITRLGRALRWSKFDELPQLFNVLRGDMTLIGPRPEVLDWVNRYTADEREVLNAKPGLTDPVQILFRHEQDFLNSAAEYEKLVSIKVRKQIEYLRCRSFSSDLATVIQTAASIISRKPSPEEIAIYAAIRSATSKEALDDPSTNQR